MYELFFWYRILKYNVKMSMFSASHSKIKCKNVSDVFQLHRDVFSIAMYTWCASSLYYFMHSFISYALSNRYFPKPFCQESLLAYLYILIFW